MFVLIKDMLKFGAVVSAAIALGWIISVNILVFVKIVVLSVYLFLALCIIVGMWNEYFGQRW